MVQWYILAGFSALAVALGDLVRKHILNHEHPMEQVAAEAPFRLLILLFLIPLVSIPSWPVLLAIVGSAALLATLLVYKNRAVRHLPISTVAPLWNISPIVLLPLAVILLGEHPAIIQIGGILLIAAGGYLLDARRGHVLRPLKTLRKHPYTGLVFLVLVLLSVQSMVDKTFLTRVGVPVFTYLFWLYLFTALISLGANYAKYRLRGVARDLRKGWFWLLFSAAAAITDISLFYSAIALPGALISLAIPIRRTATLMETILGGRLFHEDGVWRKTLGCAIMVAGVILIV